MIAPQPERLDLEEGLRRFGHAAFRPSQREAIELLLEHRRLILVAPTGGGKSLTYQLPACLFSGTTLVLSPLISLMNDQVMALKARGIPSTYLASTLDPGELRQRLRRIARGDFKLVYAAPERLASPGFRALLARLDCPLVAIDEAHCISEWGHDFRPDYLEIASVLRDLPEARVLACTATATPVVRDDILQRLDLDADTPQLVHGFARPNLRLRAREVISAKERRSLVDAQLAEARGAAILYSPTRRMSEAEAESLARAGRRCDCYHAGMPGSERERVQRAFMAGDLDVVVATNAFGMGIDRADVRAVIHLGPPGSIAAYYQEVGRAGRDGLPAYGLLLTAPQDLPRRRHLIEAPTDGRAPDPAVVENKWSLFLDLMRWAESGSCRHDSILRYFKSYDEVREGGCGVCDVCTGLASEEQDPDEVALIARQALSGVARIHGRYGLTAAAKLLKGAADERLKRARLETVSTFGLLAHREEEWIVRLLRRCVTAGWVGFRGADRPVACLTGEGVEVMQARRPARLLLPTSRRAPPPGRRSTTRAVECDELDEEAARIFNALRVHRLEIARARQVPAYVVASDRTLRELALRRPGTQEELLEIHGIGPAKAERYGAGFLETLTRAAEGA